MYKTLAAKPFRGFVEAVPAYASLAVFYDAIFIKSNQPNITSAFEFVKKYVIELEEVINEATSNTRNKIIPIPVYYNGEDLEHVAAVHQLTVEEVIKIHTSVNYRVFMTGFLPGFAYMGTVDEKIITPRKDKPRLHVAAGSVGIAGAQTGIYPMDSPGGWQLIGTTALSIFDKNKTAPCLLKAGDEVQFVSIDKNEFEKLNEH